MNQEQNNLNPNNFNTQGNNGIPNNQPLNNQSFNQGMGFNQQPINPQPQPTPSYQQPIMQEPTPQPMNNTFESGNANSQNFNSKPPKKMNLGLIIGIVVAVVAVIVGAIFLLKGNGSGNSLFGNKNSIKLYADSLELVDGNIHKYRLYKENGNEVDMKIYKLTDYLVAYQNMSKEYNYFGFALYNLDNEKTYVLESNDLGHNVENSGYINTYIRKKESNFTNINDIAVEYGNSNGANENSKENAKVEKISNTTSKVTSVKTWGEEKYTFFIDIDDSNYFEIKVTCNPATGCDLEGEQTKGTLKFFENLKINLVDGKDENKETANNKNSINDRFEYYFAFKDLDVKKFNKNLGNKKLYDYNGGELTSFPVTYDNLKSKYEPYSVYSNGNYYEVVDNAKSEIYWGISNKSYLTMYFTDTTTTIKKSMENNNFYLNLGGKYYYETTLGLGESEKEDFDIIVEKFGNPNEIYIHSEVYTAKETADYWLVYNYNDYMLAFNFTESSNKDRSKDAVLYIAPNLQDVYYIDGNSFEKGINFIKGTIYENYYKSQFDIVVK